MNLPHAPRMLLLLCAVAALLALAWPLDAVHPDALHDLLMTRDCLDLGRCDTAGAMSSLRDVHLGVSWLDLLVLGRTVASPLWLGVALALLTGAAMAVILPRHPSPDRHVLAALSVLVIATLLTSPVVLVPPTALSPFCLLATALGLAALDRPSLPLWLLTGAALGVAVDLHTVAWPLAWTLAALSWQRGHRQGALLTLIVPLATTLLYSPRAWELLWLATQKHPGYGLALLGAPLVWLLLWPLRRLQPVVQMSLVGALAWLATGLTHQFTARYALPFLGAAALAMAPRLARWRPLPVAALVVVAVLTYWRQGHVAVTWTAAERVAAAAEVNGVGWPHILTELRGENAPTLAEATGAFLPQRRLDRAQPLALVLSGDAIAGATPFASRLDLAGTQICPLGGADAGCRPIARVPGPGYTPAPFVGRSMPQQLPLDAPFAPFELRIPVRAGAPTRVAVAVPQEPLRGPRFLRDALHPAAANEPCMWQFPGSNLDTALTADAQTLHLLCPALHNPHDAPPKLLPALVEACAIGGTCAANEPAKSAPLPPEAPLPEPLRFSRSPLEARLGGLWALALFALGCGYLLRRKA